MSCPLDLSEPCGVKQATKTHAASVANFIFDTVSMYPIKLIGGAYWLVVSNFSSNANSGDENEVPVAHLSKDSRMVRAFGPL